MRLQSGEERQATAATSQPDLTQCATPSPVTPGQPVSYVIVCRNIAQWRSAVHIEPVVTTTPEPQLDNKVKSNCCSVIVASVAVFTIHQLPRLVRIKIVRYLLIVLCLFHSHWH